MLALLPIANFSLLWVLFYRRGVEWRRGFLSAALIFGTLVLLLTEALSLFGILTLPSLIVGWGLADALVAALIYRALPVPRARFERLSLFLWLLMGAVVVVVCVVGLIAFIAPPNNWDSMTYHMARVMHWIQNQSVAHYPTFIARQLYEHPWAEYAITHLQLLSGGDRLANLVQWFSLIGCTLGISLVARMFGARARGQVFAAVFCATIPMAILQGSSTQNDLVCAFWMTCTAYFIAAAAKQGLTRQNILGVGAAAGLALATKATSFIYLLPFAIWFGVLALRRFRACWRDVLLASVLLVLLNVGYLARNYGTFASFTGSDANYYVNQVMSPSYFISNVVRNLALHVAVPPDLDIRFEVSERLTEWVEGVHEFLGVSMNDPRTTWPWLTSPWHYSALTFQEDLTSAPAHLLLAVIAIAIFALRYRSWRGSGLLLYLGIVVAELFLFSLILRMQPWHNRLHLPMFVLLAAFVGCVLETALPVLVSGSMVVVLLILSVAPLLSNFTRPLVGEWTILTKDRWAQYFTLRPDAQQAYTDVLPIVQQYACDRVGLYLGGDSWEYPLWVYARDHELTIRMEHVISSVMPSDFQPCAIIRDHSVSNAPEVQIAGQTFVSVWVEEPLDVLIPQTK